MMINKRDQSNRFFIKVFYSLLLFHQAVYSSTLDLNYTLDTYLLKKDDRSNKIENIGLLIVGGNHSFGPVDMRTSLMINHSTGSPTDNYLKDSQVVSSIDTQGGEGLKPYEIYFDYKVSNSFMLRAGLVDLAALLNITDNSLALINSSFGTAADFGSAGQFGPAIYPVPSWGSVLQYRNDKFYTIASLTDPVSDLSFDVSDIVKKPKIDSDHYNAALELGYLGSISDKVALGLWQLKDSFMELPSGAYGSYFLINKTLGRYASFLRLSRSTKVSQKIYQNIVFGFNYESLFGEGDSIELGFSSAKIESKQNQEKVVEALFKKKINSITTSLSYQRIDKVSGDSASANVLTLRLAFDLETSLYH